MIEPLNLENFEAMTQLFRAYQDFYEMQSIPEEKNRHHLQRLLADENLGKIFLYKSGTTYVGFATIYYTFASTIAEQIAILNDLYVLEAHRRQGFGKQLMQHCIDYLQPRGIQVLRWITRTDNLEAQKLYSQFAAGREWMIYSYWMPNLSEK